MNTRSRYLAITCAISLSVSLGCASPSFYGMRNVARNLEGRTGFDVASACPADRVEMPESVCLEDGLSEEEAVAIGLWNNPDFLELLADIEITRADVIEAGQLANPQISTMFPLGPKQWEFALNVPLDILWLRPMRVAAAQLESGRVAERLAQDGLNVVRDIRVAYIDWQLAREQHELAEQVLTLRTKIAEIAEARLAAGAVAELDLSAIRLDTLFAESETARTAGDVELSRERLRYLLGIELTEVSIDGGSLDAPGEQPPEVSQLVDEAIGSRPDLRAVRLACSAAQQRADLARHDIWKVSGILPDINGRGKSGFEAGPGLQMTLPIFHQNQGAVARAEAEAERFSRQYAKQCDLAALEVRQAHTQLLFARREHEIWQARVVPQAEAAVRSAQEALQEDAASLLLVLETTRQLLTAKARELEAAAQHGRALAELERSVGHRLPRSLAPQSAEVQVLSASSVHDRKPRS